MNFNDYTLVAFGCSHTYGHNSHPSVHDSMFVEEWQGYDKHKEISNLYAYPQFVKDKLNFKNVLNYGTRGAGNTMIYSKVITFTELHKDDNEQYFYLIGLSGIDRELRFFQELENEWHFRMNDTMPGNMVAVAEKGELGYTDWEKYTCVSKVSANTMQEYLAYMRSYLDKAYYDLLNTISLISYLNANSIPYLAVDIGGDALNVIDKILERSESKQLRDVVQVNGRHRDLNPIDAITHFIDCVKDFDKFNYLNKYTIKKYADKQVLSRVDDPITGKNLRLVNILQYSQIHAMHYYKDHMYFHRHNKRDGHWDFTGHEFAADMMVECINDIYGDSHEL